MANPNSVQEVIRGSLLLVGAIGQNEQPSADEAMDAFYRLLDLLDSWSSERIMVYTVQRSVFPLGSKAVYTAGPAPADFIMPYAPAKIEQAYVQITTQSPVSELPIDVVEYDQWSKIIVKGTTSPIPKTLWNDRQWPRANINLYPVPQGVNNLVLYMWQQLGSYAQLTDSVVFPPGYKLAIMFNLALLMNPFYGSPLKEEVIAMAMKFKSVIAAKNMMTPVLECDEAVLSPNPVFNWLTGEPT